MIVKIYRNNPNLNQIQKIVQILRNGGVVIIPTDTVYAFACDINSNRAIEFIAKLKNKNLRKMNLSFICEDLKQVSEYAKLNDKAFKLLKKNLPGAFTFILNGNSRLPKLFKEKKVVGIRIPDHEIPLIIVKELGNPILVSSIFTDNATAEYFTDPELIEEKYGKLVDAVIDGGIGNLLHSTIVDCTQEEFEIVREGAGKLI